MMTIPSFSFQLTPQAMEIISLSLLTISVIFVILNTLFLRKIIATQRSLIPKGRLIHFIYQSIATTDLQMAQIVQNMAEMREEQKDLTLKLAELKDQFRSRSMQNKPSLTEKENNFVYCNAIKAIQEGYSLDEIALQYKLSRDELEILAAVYSPKKKKELVS